MTGLQYSRERAGFFHPVANITHIARLRLLQLTANSSRVGSYIARPDAPFERWRDRREVRCES
jgi:hypothetical protein